MPDLDQTFAALGDATRRAILARLADGETSLSAIAEPFAMSQTGVTRHVNVLAKAGLVSVSKRGRTRYCRIKATPMRAASEWLNSYERFWSANLDQLAQHLGEES